MSRWNLDQVPANVTWVRNPNVWSTKPQIWQHFLIKNSCFLQPTLCQFRWLHPIIEWQFACRMGIGETQVPQRTGYWIQHPPKDRCVISLNFSVWIWPIFILVGKVLVRCFFTWTWHHGESFVGTPPLAAVSSSLIWSWSRGSDDPDQPMAGLVIHW